ncbi:MAG: hypothetical protein IIV82_04930, partial [Ruminococcus sp.]|nr:hypothetical protein [Ruminococcus sp.]
VATHGTCISRFGAQRTSGNEKETVCTAKAFAALPAASSHIRNVIGSFFFIVIACSSSVVKK